MLSDEELVRRFISGEEKAFEELFLTAEIFERFSRSRGSNLSG